MIREFLGAILMIFRPSLPWRFPIHPFLWVSEVTLGNFLVAILMLFRPSLPWCFHIRELSFEQKE